MRPARLLRAARRLVRDPEHGRRQALVLRDLAGLRLTASPALRRARPRRTGSGTALFVSLTDTLAQVKQEAVLGKALQLDGYRPLMLTMPGSRWAERYFRAFGLDDFLHPNELLSPGATGEADRAARRFLDGPVSVQALKDLEFRGARVGQQTLSSLSRRFYAGRIRLEQPEVRPALEEVLVHSMRSVIAAERLHDRLRPDLVLFIEKGYAGYGSIYDVALREGANVVNFVAAGLHWRNSLILKRYTQETRRVHPTSLSTDSWRRVRELPWTGEHERVLRQEFDVRYAGGQKHPDAGLQEGKRLLSRDEVVARLDLDPSRKTVVLFSHILWDSNLFFGDDLFDDQETWLVETVKAACENPEVNWVVKLHPANLAKGASRSNDEDAIREAIGRLPRHVKLMQPDTDVNTFSLFSFIDAGITIRGTVGLELPCFGVPVLTAGTGRYAGLGFTADSSTKDEYLERLALVQNLPRLDDEETALAKKHAYGIFHLRPFRFTSYEDSFLDQEALRTGHPLAVNLKVTLRTPQEVEEARDLRAFSEWARDRSQLDYLRDDAGAQLPSLTREVERV